MVPECDVYVGMLVHYRVGAGQEAGSYPPGCRPAMVMGLQDKAFDHTGMYDLLVFGTSGTNGTVALKRNVQYSAEHADGTWHYPGQ